MRNGGTRKTRRGRRARGNGETGGTRETRGKGEQGGTGKQGEQERIAVTREQKGTG